MKLRILIITVVILAFVATPAFARVWNVDNNIVSNTGDFTTMEDAYNAAADGDTLYFFGSTTTYTGIELHKKLFIFGPGNRLGANPDSPVKKFSVQLSGITFSEGSQGSLISGVDMYRGIININTNDIKVRRNTANQIHIADAISNIFISQNYVLFNLTIGGNCSNIFINNNYVDDAFTSHKTSSIIVKNNIFSDRFEIYNSVINNNILTWGYIYGTGNSFSNNIDWSNKDQFGTENGNQSNVNMKIVFVGSGSGDGQWQLAEDSPAAGAGTGGTDIGMFGGDTPYVLSGLPGIPIIYSFAVSTTGTEPRGLDIHLKAKAMK